MDRRSLLLRSSSLCGTLLMSGIIPARTADVQAAQTRADDPRIAASRVSIAAAWGKLEGYLVRPADDSKPRAAVLVAHDKLGLTPHFEDVARRLGIEGYVALAPDFASRFGGTPGEAGPALEVVGMETSANLSDDIAAAVDWLKASGNPDGAIGALGFGLGATGVNLAVSASSDIRAAVTYYGHPPPLERIARIKAALLMNLASHDQFIAPEIPPFAEAVRKAGLRCEIFTYEGTERGFDDDSAAAHYSPEAARLAWSRTIAFLGATLA